MRYGAPRGLLAGVAFVACLAAASACSGTQKAAYDPCSGKACGDTCKLCDPADTDCVETMTVKSCGPDGQCSDSAASCP